MTVLTMRIGAPRRRVTLLGCAIALAGVTLGCGAARADGRSALPFWSQPYPYGYVGTRSSCEQLRLVENAYGSHYEKVWVCEPVLHSRG